MSTHTIDQLSTARSDQKQDLFDRFAKPSAAVASKDATASSALLTQLISQEQQRLAEQPADWDEF